jgi:hypothetical protein
MQSIPWIGFMIVPENPSPPPAPLISVSSELELVDTVLDIADDQAKDTSQTQTLCSQLPCGRVG